MERLGHEATLKYGKLEYDMENSLNRFDRLDGEDDFDGASTFPRPNTKAKEGGSLYVENTHLEPVSSIRMDDVEVFLRRTTYEQKLNKLVGKFLGRLKWMPLERRWEVWTAAVEEWNRLRESNVKGQLQLVDRVRERGHMLLGKAAEEDERWDELQDICEGYHCSRQKARIQCKADELSAAQRSDHELAPQMIDNSLELKVLILQKALDYGIYGDIELDQGYSFAYQITIFFPTYFQRQIIKS